MEKLLNKKTLMIVGAGLAVVLLYYLWQKHAGGSSGASTIGTTTDPNASDYSQLSGQEASDMAALAGQEASDVGGLQNELGTLQGQIPVPDTSQPTATGPTPAPDVPPLRVFGGNFAQLFPTVAKELAAISAAQKRPANKQRHQHAKTGQRHRTQTQSRHPAAPGHHAAHHPAGTGGHAVAPRSHAHHGKRRG